MILCSMFNDCKKIISNVKCANVYINVTNN